MDKLRSRSVKTMLTAMMAVLLTLMLMFSALPSNAYAANGDSGNGGSFLSAVADFLGLGDTRAATDGADRVADGSTMTTYNQVLGGDTSTQYNGRVWTDKSVSTEAVTFAGIDETVQNDSDFLVTYSALATSTMESGKSAVPVDVVFVIDNSNSMDASVGGGSSQSRLSATVDAVNASIATLMESNPASRVGVVIYGMDAETLLPLGHYEPMRNGNYIEVELDTHWSSDYWDNVTDTIFTASNNRSLTMEYGNRGTNTHMGVNAGMDLLKNATDIGEGADKHVPALVLLSDGASTSSGGGNWWDPSGRDGDGTETANSYALKVSMNAQYNKQLVNQHYGVTDADSDYACKVYTIGMGIEQLYTAPSFWNPRPDNTDYYRAQMALDPGAHLTDNNDVANAIENAWNQYQQNDSPTLNNYRFNHPGTNDISTIAYNDGYYAAENADDVTNVFDDITSTIVSARPQVPTKVEGDDPVRDGYITYTDPIGEYMELKTMSTLIWNDQVFDNPTQGTDADGNTTYTFSGTVQSPAYEEAHNANEIQITVKTDASGNQTLEVKIPATAIPLRVNTIELDTNGNVTSNTSNGAMPLRLCYTVGLRSNIDPTTLEGIGGADGVSEEYINAHTTDDGKVSFYSNQYTGDGHVDGNAKVEFTPASTNPFYFLQEDTPIYSDAQGRYPVQNFNSNGTYYVPATYYEGTQIRTTYVARAASTMEKYVHDGQDGYYIEAGAPRLGNLEDLTGTKVPNTTGTASTYRYPDFNGDVATGSFVVYLGNNGRMQLDEPASLTIAKNVTEDTGLTAPADAEFTFEVTAQSKAGQTLNAVKHTSAGNEDTTITFGQDGKASITLKADESFEIKGMSNTDYSVQETPLPQGFAVSAITGTATTTTNVQDGTASGRVGTDDVTVSYTNNYSVERLTVTPDDLGINGTKTISGRDFQTDDTFSFYIVAGQTTPDAPLPTEDADADGNATTATINPESGKTADFTFGSITFDKPGEYRYGIREVIPQDEDKLAGVDYDEAIFRVCVVIVDNGDGTLRLANVDEINSDLTYTSNPMTQVYKNGQLTAAPDGIKFENHYSAESATATIQGTKVLDSTNSDKQLTDDAFTFKIEALGSNTDGGDQFTTDPVQPMPTETEVGNVANGNVQFETMTFTQAMVGKTFGYKITEEVPMPNPQNGTTYDTAQKIVKIAVSDDGQGHVRTTVTPNDGQQTPNHFTFTNRYQPSSVTIGTQTEAGITVQKTFTGHEWTDAYSFDYTLSAKSNTAGIDVADMPMPANATLTVGHPASGTENTGVFGEMTFVKEGTYVYEVKETNGGHGGVAYDTHTATVTVTVEEDRTAGTLSAAVSYDNRTATTEADRAETDNAAFTNTYTSTFDSSTAVSLNGTKNLTVNGNSDHQLGQGEFYFAVTALDNAPMGNTQPLVGNAAGSDDDQDGTWTAAINNLLNNITYAQTDMDGQADKAFRYIITEQQSSSPAIQNDGAAYQVTVTVTDDGNGKLSAAAPVIEKGSWNAETQTFTKTEDAQAVVFNNTYTPASATVAPVEITKTLTGDRATGLQADEFSFTMSVKSADPSDGVTLPQQTTLKNNADGKVQFGNITFTKAGTYVIQVVEDVPQGATQNADGSYTFNGVTYSTNVLETTFTVRDENGVLVANRTGTSGSSNFTNTYNTTGTLEGAANLTVTKNLTGRPNNEWTDDDVYTFTISAKDGDTNQAVQNGLIELPGSVVINKDTPDHKAAFGNMVFHKPGTYHFIISETADVDGVTNDANTHEFTVIATDQNNGTMKIEVTGNDAQNLTFTNSYNPDETTLDGQTYLGVTKTFTGRTDNEWFDTDQFTFVLAADTTDPTTAAALQAGNIALPAETELTIDKTNNASAAFGSITFKEPGTYKFTVTEKDPRIAGVSYDATPRTITVSVVDNNDATMTATIVEDQSDPLDFTNTYNATGTLDGATDLKVSKTLEGRSWQAGDSFSFKLEANDDTTAQAIADGSVELPQATEIAIDANSDLKEAAFGNITFTKEGTYSFKVTEQPSGLEGVTDDSDAVRVINVTVTDNNDGTMTVTKAEGSEALSFTNTYNTSGDLVGADNLKVTKTLTGRDWQDGDSFSFVLNPTGETVQAVERGEIVMPGNADGITISYNANDPDAAHEATFGNITFKAEGTYTFEIREQEGSLGGITYDGTVKNITVTTKDNGDGTLKVDVSGDTNPSFTNTYAPDQPTTVNGTANLNVTKALTGRSWQAGDSFTFTLTGGDEATNAAIADGSVKLPENAAGITISYNADNPNAAHQAAFGDITFTKTGNYVFNITEQQGNIGGISYDTTTHAVKVSVEDNYDGTLTATVTEGANPTITNTYSPDKPGTLPGATNLTVTKNFTGRDGNTWLDTDSFSFKLEAGDDATKAAVDAGSIILPGNANKVDITAESIDHKASFGDITFTAAGDYTFNVSEILPEGVTTDNPTKDGITYDTSVKTVKVTVTDNLDGTLTAALAQGSEALTFTNTYSTTDVPVEPGDNTEGSSLLNVTKELTGREWEPSDSFTFTIEGADDKTMAAIADGTITMPNPASVTIDNTTIDTATQKHTAGFGEIVFNKVGTYKFNIKETKPETAIPGINYDEHTYTVTITVTDNHDGTLKAVVTGEAADSTFTNAYTPTPVDTGDDVSTQLAGTKVLNGKTLKAGEFSFTVEPQNGAPTPEGGTTVTNTAATEGYNFGFGNITFDKPGTYTYLVKEVNDNKAGYTYDGTTYTVTYTVTDNVATGKLELSRAISVDDEARDAIVFNNSFTPAEVSAPAALSGTKAVTGNAYTLQGGEFTFELVNEAGDVVNTATNAADGSYSFDTLSFAEDGIYKYTVREAKGNAAGMSYDGTTYNVTYNVSYNSTTGTLSVDEPTITGGSGDLSFTNTYDPSDVAVALSGTKVLEGRDINDGEFQFALYDESGEEVATATNVGGGFTFPAINYTAAGDYTYTIAEINTGLGGVAYDDTTYDVTVHVTDEGGVLAAAVEGEDAVIFNNTYTPTPATVPSDAETGLGGTKTLEGRTLADGEFTFELRNNTGAVVATATNNADGSFGFEGITFDQAGVYTYTVSEANTGAGGVNYDSTVYQAVITVIDNGEGQLVASVDKQDIDGNAVDGFTFTNTYDASDIGVTITAIKQLEGAELADGQFDFVIKDADGNTVAEASNTADGRIPFDTLTFSAAGEYTYTIEEVKGNDRSIAYDDTVYPVVINVTDDGNGALNADVTYTDGDPIFVNTANQPTTIIDNVYTGIMNNAQAVLTAFVCIVVAILAATALIVRRRNTR